MQRAKELKGAKFEIDDDDPNYSLSGTYAATADQCESNVEALLNGEWPPEEAEE